MAEKVTPDGAPKPSSGTMITSTPLDEDTKPNVSEMFKKMGAKLGWFQYNNLEIAMKTLSKSSKKKSSRSRRTYQIQQDKQNEGLQNKKLSFNETPPLCEKLPNNVGSDEFTEPVLPRKSKACTDLTQEWRHKKSEKKIKKRISIIPPANIENISPGSDRSARYSVCSIDLGNPLTESTRIHSRQSIDNLLNVSSISNASSGNNPTNNSTNNCLSSGQSRNTSTTDWLDSGQKDDSYKQLNIHSKRNPCSSVTAGEDMLTNELCKLHIESPSVDSTRLYATAEADEEATDCVFYTVIEESLQESGNGHENREQSEDYPEFGVDRGYVNASANLSDSSSCIEIQDASTQAESSLSIKQHSCVHNSTFDSSASNSPSPRKNTNTDTSSHSKDQTNPDRSSSEIKCKNPDRSSPPVKHNLSVKLKSEINFSFSSNSSYIDIQDVSLQTSVIDHESFRSASNSSAEGQVNSSQKCDFDERELKPQTNSSITQGQKNSLNKSDSDKSDSSYVEVKDNSIQTSNIINTGEWEVDFVLESEDGQCIDKKLPDDSKSTDKTLYFDAICAPDERPTTKSTVLHQTFDSSSDEDSFDEIQNLIKNKSDIKSKGDGMRNGLISGSHIDSVKTYKENGNLSKQHTEHFLDLSSDSDVSLPDIDEKPLADNQNEEVVMSSPSDSSEFLSDRGIPRFTKIKSIKQSNEKSQRTSSSESEDLQYTKPKLLRKNQNRSKNEWRMTENYASESSEEELESFFQRMKAPRNDQGENSISVKSIKDFIVEDDELSSSSNAEEFYLTTNSILHTPKQKIEPIIVSDEDYEDVFKSDIKPIKRKTKPEEKKTPKWTQKVENDKKYSFLKSLSHNVKEELCDREALRYSKSFKKTKEDLTKKLFKLYNETVFDNQLPADFLIQWNNRLLKTAGYCVYKKNAKIRDSSSVRIELSTKVCDSAERVRDTLIHELCHAAVWIVHGKNDGHGPYWRFWARKANLTHPEIPVIGRCHTYSISTKYTYQCGKCGYSIGRHSKSLDTRRKVCGFCHGEFVLINNHQKSTRSSNSSATPSTPRTPNKFALFVKENYRDMKQKQKDLKHGQIMKLLGKEFSEKNKIT